MASASLLSYGGRRPTAPGRKHSAIIEKAGIRAYSALADQGKRTSLLTIDDFLYGAQRDVYTSPETRSCTLGAKTTGEDTQGRVREVRCELFSLQRVSSQEQVYK